MTTTCHLTHVSRKMLHKQALWKPVPVISYYKCLWQLSNSMKCLTLRTLPLCKLLKNCLKKNCQIFFIPLSVSMEARMSASQWPMTSVPVLQVCYGHILVLHFLEKSSHGTAVWLFVFCFAVYSYTWFHFKKSNIMQIHYKDLYRFQSFKISKFKLKWNCTFLPDYWKCLHGV